MVLKAMCLSRIMAGEKLGHDGPWSSRSTTRTSWFAFLSIYLFARVSVWWSVSSTGFHRSACGFSSDLWTIYLSLDVSIEAMKPFHKKQSRTRCK